MEEHPIQGLMTTAMENLKDMIEVNTIIGDPVESPDGSVIIPVSKVGFGFAAGGTEFMPSNSGSQGDSSGDSGGGNSEAVFPFGGGSGGGVSITPVAFLIVNPKGIKMVHLDESIHLYEKLIDFAPKAVEKIQQLLKEGHSEKEGSKRDEKNQEHNLVREKSDGKEKEKEKDKDSGNKKDEEQDSDKKKETDSDESPSIYDI